MAGSIMLEQKAARDAYSDIRQQTQPYTNVTSSIKNVTENVLDLVQEEMQQFFPTQGGEIILHIVGVKSKQIAERDIEVKREYEAAR